MKATLYKLKEGYVLCSNEPITDVRPYKGRKHLEKESIINTFPTYLTDLSECKLILSESPDFSLLSEEDVKRIRWFDYGLLGAKEVLKAKYNYDDVIDNARADALYKGFMIGFQKHAELTADRRFSLEDIISAYHSGGISMHNKCIKHDWKGVYQKFDNDAFEKSKEEYIQSLSKPKSWEVEYKEENGVYTILSILK